MKTNLLNKITLTLTLLLNLSFSYAQNIDFLATYPLLDDLADAFNNNSDIILEGNPVLPAAPSGNLGVCNNGIFVVFTNGQNIQTPVINNFDINNFSFDIDVELAAFDTDVLYSNIIMGGDDARWFGLIVDATGQLGIKINNQIPLDFTWTGQFLSLNSYTTLSVRYDYGLTTIGINGLDVFTVNLPKLTPFQNDFNFSTNDFGSGRALEGCIRDFTIFKEESQNIIFSGSFE
jgi:hypothetical protein